MHVIPWMDCWQWENYLDNLEEQRAEVLYDLEVEGLWIDANFRSHYLRTMSMSHLQACANIFIGRDNTIASHFIKQIEQRAIDAL